MNKRPINRVNKDSGEPSSQYQPPTSKHVALLMERHASFLDLYVPFSPNLICMNRVKFGSQIHCSSVAVLSTALDLVDLSDPGESIRKDSRRSPLRRKGSSKSPRRRARAEETELVQVEGEHLPASPTPEKVSLDSGQFLREEGWTTPAPMC